jgi:hypothetical protein
MDYLAEKAMRGNKNAKLVLKQSEAAKVHPGMSEAQRAATLERQRALLDQLRKPTPVLDQLRGGKKQAPEENKGKPKSFKAGA